MILSANTGHLDLIERTECFPLERQTPLTTESRGFRGTEGWGESNVDEIVEELERIYTQRGEAQRRGLRSAKAMSQLSWPRQILKVYRAVNSLR